jgi:hypothetical protein
MMRKSFERNTALAGMAALALAGSPALAAIGSETPTATPDRPGETCSNSTDSTRQLAVIEKSGDREFQCLGVSLDGDTIKAIRLETHSFPPAGRPADQAAIKIEEFPEAVIESSQGAVLDGVPGHDAIVLRGQFSTPPGKVELVASYLYNGFTSDYHSCQLAIDQTPDTGWRLVNHLDQTVSHIVIRTRQIPMFGVFGIANLEGACP